MNPPDYRKAACCGNCYYMAKIGFRCVRFGGKVDMMDTCAGFSTAEEVEKAFNGA